MYTDDKIWDLEQKLLNYLEEKLKILDNLPNSRDFVR
jgi:hypothetical protein